jgi:hypothetical protein
MTWLRQGQEIGLIGETFTPDPHKPAVIGSHLQSEFGYWFERWSWPDRQRISHCSIGMRTGWPTALLETPDPHLAFFEWYDQGEAGYEGIMLDNFQGDTQDPQESYEIGVPLIGHHGQLVFSADARYLVRWHSLSFADNATCTWERTLLVAYLTIIDRRIPSVRDVPIYRTLSPGWKLPDSLARQFAGEQPDKTPHPHVPWVQSCAFVDDIHLVLSLIDGTSESILAPEAALAALAPLPSHPPTPHTMPDVNQELLQPVIAEYHRTWRTPAKRLRHPQGEAAIVRAEWPDRREIEWIAGADGSVIWDPGDALAMTWLANGQEVGAVRGAPYAYWKPGDQQLVFERRSWPDLTRLHRLELQGWSGYTHELLEVPHAQAVVLVWRAPHLDGPAAVTLRRLALNPTQTQEWLEAQIPMSEATRVAALRASGRWLLCLQHEGVRWPSHEAMFRWAQRSITGIATLYDWHRNQACDLTICEDFPANWVPPDLNERRSPLLPWFYETWINFIESVAFVNDQQLAVEFATKRARTIMLD